MITKKYFELKKLKLYYKANTQILNFTI